MGGFYGSVQLRCEDRSKVLAAAEAVAREMGIKCLVGPALNGWVGVYPEGNGRPPSKLSFPSCHPTNLAKRPSYGVRMFFKLGVRCILRWFGVSDGL